MVSCGSRTKFGLEVAVDKATIDATNHTSGLWPWGALGSLSFTIKDQTHLLPAFNDSWCSKGGIGMWGLSKKQGWAGSLSWTDTTSVHTRQTLGTHHNGFHRGSPRAKGKTTIFVSVDRFSKYAHFLSLTHLFTAVQVTKLFMSNVYRVHGLSSVYCYIEW